MLHRSTQRASATCSTCWASSAIARRQARPTLPNRALAQTDAQAHDRLDSSTEVSSASSGGASTSALHTLSAVSISAARRFNCHRAGDLRRQHGGITVSDKALLYRHHNGGGRMGIVGARTRKKSTAAAALRAEEVEDVMVNSNAEGSVFGIGGRDGGQGPVRSPSGGGTMRSFLLTGKYDVVRYSSTPNVTYNKQTIYLYL